MPFDPARRTTPRTEGVEVTTTRASWRSNGSTTVTLEQYRQLERETEGPRPPERGTRRHGDPSARKVRWWDFAVCKGRNTKIFFPVNEEQAFERSEMLQAMAICRTCPVIEPCRAEAVANNEIGVWGATSRGEREAIRKQARPSSGRTLAPLQQAIMDLLADGNWHSYDEIVVAVERHVTVSRALSRYNIGRDEAVTAEYVTESQLRSGRRKAVVDTLRDMRYRGYLESDGSAARDHRKAGGR